LTRKFFFPISTAILKKDADFIPFYAEISQMKEKMLDSMVYVYTTNYYT